MQTLNNLTDDADQLMTMVMPDGTAITMEFNYRPAIQRWALSLSTPGLTLNGYNLKQGPNILRPWRNVIPFGIAILSSTGVDPINVGDFLNGTVTVNMLTADEVQQVENEMLAPLALVGT